MRLYSIFNFSLIILATVLGCAFGLPLTIRAELNAILAGSTKCCKIIRIRDDTNPNGAPEAPSGSVPTGPAVDGSDVPNVHFHHPHTYTYSADPGTSSISSTSASDSINTSTSTIASTTVGTTVSTAVSTTASTTVSTAPTPTSSEPPSYWYTEPISMIDVYLRCINKQQADALVALMQATSGITPEQIADTIGRIAVYQVGDTWVQPGWCTYKSSDAG
ncbi:hypothetical protein FRB95_007537 [Tulasnella sp. JGI-2019a]|nr:hypothetical protein FRB95_007537 [Tulasnella sp. JGI-2019a]